MHDSMSKPRLSLVFAGVGRGLLGVVGLPLSGALGLVGTVTNGLASTAGLTPVHAIRRPGRIQGVCSQLPSL